MALYFFIYLLLEDWINQENDQILELQSIALSLLLTA